MYLLPRGSQAAEDCNVMLNIRNASRVKYSPGQG